jgi:hypothetical protein
MPRTLSRGPFRYVARSLASVRWITVSTIVPRSLRVVACRFGRALIAAWRRSHHGATAGRLPN